MAITVEKLVAEIGADITAFNKGAAAVEAGMTRLENTVEQTGTRIERRFTTMFEKTAAQAKATFEQMAATVTASAQKSGQSADQMGQRIGRAANSAEMQMRRFQRQLELTEAKLQEVGKSDPLAHLRATFYNLVPDSELAKLSQARSAIAAIKREQAETARAAQQAAREEEQAIQNVIRQQERYNAELARTRAELLSVAGIDRNAPLRVAHPGATEAELTRLRQTAEATAAIPRGSTAAKNLAMSVGTGIMNASAGMTLGLVAAGKEAADFDKMLLTLRNNTNMTDAEFQVMRRTVTDLGTTYGQSFEDVAGAYMHAANYGYKFSDAQKIVTEATKASRVTGSDAAATGQLLARVMHENSIATVDAGKAMNILWFAAGQSDAKLQDLVGSGTKAFAMGAQLKQSFSQVAGALSVFMASGLSAAQSGTAFINMLNNIQKPVPTARRALEELHKQHIDLINDFSSSGLRARQFSGVMEDVRAASAKAGIPFAVMATTLFPGLRSEIGALIGTSTGGYTGLMTRLHESDAIWKGLDDPIGKRLPASMALATTQFDILANKIRLEFMPVGRDFLKIILDARPVIETFAHMLDGLMRGFMGLPEPIKLAVIGLGALRLATFYLGNPLSSVLRSAIWLRDAFIGIKAAGIAAAEGITAVEVASAAGGATGNTAKAVGGSFFVGLAAKYPWLASMVTRGGALAASGAGIGLGTVGGVLLSQEAAGRGGDIPGLGPNASVKDMQAMLTRWEGLVHRYQQVLHISQQPFLTQPNAQALGRIVGPGQTTQAYLSEHKASIQGIYAKIDELRQRIVDTQAVGVVSGAASEQAKALGLAIVKQATNAVVGPQGKETCAAFVDQILRSAGVEIPKLASTRQIASALIQAGSVPHPASQAQPGEFLMFHGPQYDRGAHLQGGGYHAGVYLGGGLVRQSTGGKISTRPLSSYGGEVTAFNIPQSLAGTGGLEPGPGEAGPKLPEWFTKLSQATEKLTPLQRLQKEETAKLKEAQAGLNNTFEGGVKWADALAAKFAPLGKATVAHLIAVVGARKAREAQTATDQKYRTVLKEAEGAVREAQTGELTGITRLKTEIPGLTDARAKAILNMREYAKYLQQEAAQHNMLTQKLADFRSELAGVTAKSDVHRLAIELTGKTYEQLSKSAQVLIDKIMGINDAMAGATAAAKLQDIKQQIEMRMRLATQPPETRRFYEEIGQESVSKINPLQLGLMYATYKKDVLPTIQAEALQAKQERIEKEIDEYIASRRETLKDRGEGDTAGARADRYWGHGIGREATETLSAADLAARKEKLKALYGDEETAKTTRDNAAAIEEFNRKMQDSKAGFDAQITGGARNPMAQFQEFLRGQKELQAAITAGAITFQQAYKTFQDSVTAPERAAKSAELFRGQMVEIQKQAAILAAGDPFKAWAISLMQIDSNGLLTQLLDPSQLQQLYNITENVKYITTLSEGTTNAIVDAVKSTVTDFTRSGGDFQNLQNQLRQLQLQRLQIQGQPYTLLPNKQGELAVINQQIQDVDNKLKQFQRSAESIVKNFFQGVLAGFKQMLVKMATDFLSAQLLMLTKKLFTNLFGMALGAGAAGAAGPGVSLPGGTAGASGAWADIGVQAAQSGESVFGGRAYLVGERGPELFVPHGSGSVMSNNATRARTSLQGESTTHVTINVYANDVSGFRRSKQTIATEMQHALTRNQRRA